MTGARGSVHAHGVRRGSTSSLGRGGGGPVYSPNVAQKTTGAWGWRYLRSPRKGQEEGGEEGLNQFIDPNKAISKLLRHGMGLFVAELALGGAMLFIAAFADWKYGYTVWYSERVAGAKLVVMQYLWAVFNLLSGVWGIRAYLAWKERLGLDRGRRILTTKIQLLAGWFTWTFGVWTSAVLFVSFKDYTLRRGVYPADLSGLYVSAVLCCVFGSLWCLSKLLSLGAYTARLVEEWRVQPHGSSAGIDDPEIQMAPSTARSLSQTGAPENNGDGIVTTGRRKSSMVGGAASSRRRGSTSSLPTAPPIYHHRQLEQHLTQENSNHSSAAEPTAPLALDPAEIDGEVLLPHEFERLWARYPLQGSFSTGTLNMPSQDDLVTHLSNQGFQVVAAGTVGRILRVMLCAREAMHASAWFLAELSLVEGESGAQFDASFKSEDSELVGRFVQKFRLHRILHLEGTSEAL